MIKLLPSLIAADLLNLGKQIQQLDPYVDGYHLDIMDFHFVPNLAFSLDTINAIRKATEKPLSIHLMVEYPEKYFDRLALAKGDRVSIHPECRSNLSLQELIHLIDSYSWTSSIALNPETPTSTIASVAAPLHHILLMSVHPGFSGQPFMPIVLHKIAEVQKLNPHISIAIDGGINLNNASQIAQSGAQELIMGSALFSSDDLIHTIKYLKSLLDR